MAKNKFSNLIQLNQKLAIDGWQPVTDPKKVPAGSQYRSEEYYGSTNTPNQGHTTNQYTQQYWKPAVSAAPVPTAAPVPEPIAPVAPPMVDPQQSAAAYGNPDLTIPGVDVRLTGENIGIKAKRSNSRASGSTSKGTSRLIIPRSSTNAINI
jgi:hypothetical protein